MNAISSRVRIADKTVSLIAAVLAIMGLIAAAVSADTAAASAVEDRFAATTGGAGSDTAAQAVVVSSQADLLTAVANGATHLILGASITITSDVNLPALGFTGTIERRDANHKIIDGGGYFTHDGTIYDVAKGSILFQGARPGQLRFYAPSNIDGQMTVSEGGSYHDRRGGNYAWRTTYVRPFLSGAFNNSTRELYMFAPATGDCYDAYFAAYNSLPPSGGQPPQSIERSGTILIDDRTYELSGTIYLSRGTQLVYPQGALGRSGFSAMAGFSEKLPNPRSGGKTYLLNSYSAGGFHNADFNRVIRGVAFNCNSRADGIRISGAEFSSFSKITVRNIRPGSYGITFARGTCNVTLSDSAVRNRASRDKSFNMAAPYYFEDSCNTITIINGKANNMDKALAFSPRGRHAHNILVINTGFEHANKLIDINWPTETASTSDGTIELREVFIQVDADDGVVARWNGRRKGLFSWTGKVRNLRGKSEPKIVWYGTEYNLSGRLGPFRNAGDSYFNASFKSADIANVRSDEAAGITGELTLPGNTAVADPTSDHALTLGLAKSLGGRVPAARSALTAYSSTPTAITATLPAGALPASTLLTVEVVVSGGGYASTENFWMRRYIGAIRSFGNADQIRQSHFALVESAGGPRGSGVAKPTVVLSAPDASSSITATVSAGGDTNVKAQVEVFVLNSIAQ